MARLCFAVILLAAMVLQALIYPQLLTIRVFPNLVLVLLLCWSALRGLGEGAIWAVGTGLLFDAIALDPLGTNGLAFLAAVPRGMWAGRRFFQASIFMPIPIAIVATIVYAVIVLIIRAGNGSGIPISALGPLLLLQALLNSLSVLLVYPVTRQLNKWVTSPR